jgi:uncharacterized protein (DUF1501 family)
VTNYEENDAMHIQSRRQFLGNGIKAAGAVGMLGKLGAMNAFAQSSATGYKALVCLYLNGGNDGHNTIIPVATAQQNFSLYASGRQNLALAQSSLLPIMNGQDVYGLHPSIPELQSLYNSGNAAVLANVGNLVQPITRSQFATNNSAIIPGSLFSHSDQTTQWQSAIPNGIASSGWGGRITDLLQGQNSSAIFPPITSTGACGVFCTGRQTSPATVPPPVAGLTGATGMAKLAGVSSAPSGNVGHQQLLTFDNGLQLVQAGNAILTRGENYANTLTGLLQSSQIKTVFPSNNPLAAQLQTVANVMAVRNQLGLSRQIFFCQLDGFDTHASQFETQLALLPQLSQAIYAFYQATLELGLDRDVTTFTASEFGRTLNPSGVDGSDHAWGNHHFIVGGAVKGGQFYGNYPSLALGGSDDANSRGTLIPTTSIAQYGSTLAQWFGVNSANLATVFPNIGNFSSSKLGFLG